MVWLIGLLVLLVLLLVFLLLPVSDWRSVIERLKQMLARRGSSTPPAEDAGPPALVDRLSAGWRDFLRRLRQAIGPHSSSPGRTWEESATSPAAGRPSWEQRSGRPAMERMMSPAAAATRATPRHQAPLREFRWWLIGLFVLVLVVGLVLSLYPWVRLPGPRPGQFTIALADLGEDGLLTSSPAGEQASADLLEFLQQEINRAGLTDMVELRPVHGVPANAAAADAQARSSNVDLFLWGWVKGGEAPSYVLTLILSPRSSRGAPELAEYFQVMMTPPRFALGSAAGAGLSRENLARTLIWLARFYMGRFDEIEGAVAGTVQCPDLPVDVITFHCAGLMWLQGKYGEAHDTYASLGGMIYQSGSGGIIVQSATCQGVPDLMLCVAALNNQAASLLTREEVGELPPSAMDQPIGLLLQASEAISTSTMVQYNLGRAYMARRAWGEAVDALWKVIAKDPRHARALAALSETYRKMNDAGRAEKYARLAVEAGPDLAEAHLAMGRYWLGMDKLSEAGGELDKAVALAEGEGKRRRSAEVALGESAQPNARRAAYLAAWALRNDPLLSRAHFSRANRFLLRAQEEANPGLLEYFWRLLTGDPDSMDSARNDAAQALQRSPSGYEALYLQGYLAFVQGAYDDAVAAYQKAQQQDDTAVETYVALARTYQAQGKADQAAEQYNQLLGQRDTWAQAQGYFGLGELAQKAGDLVKAREEYLRAVESYLGYAEALLQLGLVELKSEPREEESAMDHFSLAAENARSQYWIRLAACVERGEIFLQRYLQNKLDGNVRPDQLEKARTEFEKSQERPANEPGKFPLQVTTIMIEPAEQKGRGYGIRYLNGLGRVAYEEGNDSEAGRLFQQALQVDPGSFDALYGQGRVYLTQGNSGAALPYFLRAVQVNPASITARYYFGVACYAQLREGDARSAFERVNKLCEEQKEQPQRKADDLEGCQQAPGWLEKLGATSP